MRRTLIALLLLSAPCLGQTPNPAPDAKAVMSLPNGDPIPKTWPLGTVLKISAKKSVAGTLPKSYRYRIDPPWIDQHSSRSDDGSGLDVSSGRNPKSITIYLDVAKGDTTDGISQSIDFVIDPDEPGDSPIPTPTVDPNAELLTKVGALSIAIDAGFNKVVAKLDSLPTPAPTPVPPAPAPVPVTPAFTGHIHATLIFDVDEPSTAQLRASSVKADLKTLNTDWYVAPTAGTVAKMFASYTTADGLPAVYFTDDTGKMLGSLKAPTTKAQVVTKVQQIRGGTN